MPNKRSILREIDEDLASLMPEESTHSRGIRGRRGEKGDTGLDGEDGIDGNDGKDGKDGKDGVDGRDGIDGKDGNGGKDGRDGNDGEDGKKGEKGDTGEAILPSYEEFLELLKEKKIDYKYISNSPDKGPIDQRWSGRGINQLRKLKDTGIKTVSEDYTVDINDFTILVDSSGGDVIVTLPSAASAENKIYNIKRISVGNDVTVDSGTDDIDGMPDSIIVSQYDSIAIQSDKVQWWII